MSTEEKQNFQTYQDSDSIEYPKNEKEASSFIKKFYKSGIPIELIGTGSKKKIGKPMQCAKTLSLSKLSGIVEYLPEELYIKVKACTPIKLTWTLRAHAPPVAPLIGLTGATAPALCTIPDMNEAFALMMVDAAAIEFRSAKSHSMLIESSEDDWSSASTSSNASACSSKTKSLIKSSLSEILNSIGL